MKRTLLIAGGGTLGTYVSEELLSLGHQVDVICLEDKTSPDSNLKFYKAEASLNYLFEFLSERKYDGIVNFIHYENVDEYKRVYELLIKKTKHLIFLSSYRVYADSDSPITEDSPKLIDVVSDKVFLETEDYAIPKSKGEAFLKNECAGQPWTIVRPVISFSDLRLDLFMYSRHEVLEYAESGKELIMPSLAKNLVAGIDWAGNTGKLMARLMFNPDTYGECYTISSGQNLTWETVANNYTEVIGLKVKWTEEDEFLKIFPNDNRYIYDRRYNREVDASKVLNATGLTPDDFKSIKEGIRIEVEKIRR